MESGDGKTCPNRFDTLIPKFKPTVSAEVCDIVLETMRVKDTIEEENRSVQEIGFDLTLMMK